MIQLLPLQDGLHLPLHQHAYTLLVAAKTPHVHVRPTLRMSSLNQPPPSGVSLRTIARYHSGSPVVVSCS